MALLIRRTVAAPLAVIWDLLVDTRQWPKWGPSVLAVQCNEQRITADSRGRVRTVAGIWVPFHITAFDDEEQHYWQWQVCGVTATGHRLHALADGRTELVFEVPWAATPYALICREAARRIAMLSEAAPGTGVDRQVPRR